MQYLQQKKSETIRIISPPSTENPFVVLYKPAGIPTAPLAKNPSAEKSALELALELFPEIKKVCGKLEHEFGLLHRIDTATRGLVLLATTQNAYNALCQSQKDGLFEKHYAATCEVAETNSQLLGGFPPEPIKLSDLLANRSVGQSDFFCVKSFFRSYGKGSAEVRPVTDLSNVAAQRKSGQTLYETKIELCSCAGPLPNDFPKNEGKQVAVKCSLQKGFRHQVRCHLAWCGLPICGDQIYNYAARTKSSKEDSEAMKFEACGFSFPHPATKEIVSFSVAED